MMYTSLNIKQLLIEKVTVTKNRITYLASGIVAKPIVGRKIIAISSKNELIIKREVRASQLKTYSMQINNNWKLTAPSNRPYKGYQQEDCQITGLVVLHNQTSDKAIIGNSSYTTAFISRGENSAYTSGFISTDSGEHGGDVGERGS